MSWRLTATSSPTIGQKAHTRATGGRVDPSTIPGRSKRKGIKPTVNKRHRRR